MSCVARALRVSVVMPTRNEAETVVDAISSLLRQQTDGFDLEILVVDGCSTDGAAEILSDLARREPRVRVLRNPHRTTPHGMNIGLKAASGAYVAIVGSHATYAPNYIATCLRELHRHRAVGCSGRVLVRPANSSRVAELVSWTFTSRFASSSGSFRTVREGYVDSIPYPVFEKAAVEAIGGYNERLKRNQDNDLNARLRAAGHNLYLTYETESVYRTPPKVRDLMRYAFRNGYWNALTLRENARALSPRHIVPLVFVGGLLVLVVGGAVGAALDAGPRGWLWLAPAGSVLALHLCMGGVTAVSIGVTNRRLSASLMPVIILAFHLSYGSGSLVAAIARRSPSDSPASDPVAGSQRWEARGAAARA